LTEEDYIEAMIAEGEDEDAATGSQARFQE